MNKKSSSLKAGIDYPKNWGQFVDWFHDEQACRDYLRMPRRPNGFIRPLDLSRGSRDLKKSGETPNATHLAPLDVMPAPCIWVDNHRIQTLLLGLTSPTYQYSASRLLLKHRLVNNKI